MYRVKFYKRDTYYFYLFNDKGVLVDKYLTFGSLVNYLEENNIDFNYVKLNCSFNDLFRHIVDYYSIKRVISYKKVQEDKLNYVSYKDRLYKFFKKKT